jgi:hypothetical protein
MRSLEAYYVISKSYYTHHAHGFQQISLEVLYAILTIRTWVSISDGRVPGLWGLGPAVPVVVTNTSRISSKIGIGNQDLLRPGPRPELGPIWMSAHS